MVRFSNIAVMVCLITLGGCNNKSAEQKPIWEKVKIGDLAPAGGNQQEQIQRVKGIYFQVHIFLIPAEETDKLNEISQILYVQPFRFNHFNAFNANSFSAAYGRINMGDQIFKILSNAGAEKTGTTSLMLNYGQSDDIPITRLFESRNIYYISEDGRSETKTIGPGVLTLRMKADQIPGSRGVCYVKAVPVFPFPFTADLPNVPQQEVSKDIVFNCCGFSLKMSPGDYIFLRAQKYIDNQNSLASLFFSRPGIKPAVSAYLIVCTNIED
jgi:hypothetical protein